MEKLNELIKLCKGAVLIEINDHRSYYHTVKQELDELRADKRLTPDELSPEIEAIMIERDQLIRLNCYPISPIGFHTIYHYDLEMAAEKALSEIKGEAS